MSLTPWHGGVLAAAAAVASPALWSSVVEGTLPLDDALTRYLLSVMMCWVALNVVAELMLPGSSRMAVIDQPDDPAAGEPVAHRKQDDTA